MNRERSASGKGRRLVPVPWSDERGSILIVSLVLVFVMTLLGLAFFDLAELEGRLGLTAQADVRALEVAQAGLERAMWALWNDYIGYPGAGGRSGGDRDWSNGGGSEWTCVGGCSAAAFRLLNIKALVVDVPGGGRFSLSLKLLTQGEAAASLPGLPLTCDTGSPGYNPTFVCRDLAFLRSMGTVGGTAGGSVAGYSATRTIQVLVQAIPNPANVTPFLGGVTAGGLATGGISGNVIVAGSIHLLADSPALTLGGSSGQRNSWAGLDSGSLSRLNPLPKVCAPGATCDPTNPSDPNLVETLEATLRIAPRAPQGGDTGDVMLSGNANKIGVSTATETYAADASRKGKGPVDGVFVDHPLCQRADPACGITPNLPSFDDPSKVWVDGGNKTRGYQGAPPAFPQLMDPVQIGNMASPLPYACPAGSSCAGSPDFFVSRAANLSSDANYLGTLGSTAGLKDNTAAFTISVAFTDKNGNAVNGQICWQRTTGSNLPPANTLEFGAPTCATPTSPSNPLLLYFASPSTATRGFMVERQGGPTDMNYRGAAVLVTNGLVKIEETFQTCASGNCAGQKFPEHHLLGLMTTGNMEVGQDNSNIDRVMGFLYTGCPSVPCPAGTGNYSSSKQTNVVGSVAAKSFNFTSNVPSFFQVPQDYASLPAELTAIGGGTGTGAPTWSVGYVRRFWLECRSGATPTSPSTVTGLCAYQ